MMNWNWCLCEYSLVIALFLLLTHASGECEVTVRPGDTLSQISLEAGCGSFRSAGYIAMSDLNKRLGRFTDSNTIPIGSKILIPDLCYSGSRPARCAAVNDCTNGNADDVCPSSSTCENTDLSFACACKPNAIRVTNDVCSTRIPGGASNNHCTKSCMADPCSPNPCMGGACTINGTTFACMCPVGSQLSGKTCVNMCNGVNCGIGGTGCSNGQCLCRPGYELAAGKKSCVDRCSVSGAVPCSGPLSSCSAGTCTCGGGNVLLGGGVCESSTECNSTSFVCIGGQCAVDETNQRVCRCPSGMILNAANTCVDIDECTDGTDQCVPPATCVKQAGMAYVCSCEKHNTMNDASLILKNQFECGQPCQKNCNGVGICSDGVCACQPGFVTDPNHGCRARCPNDCSGKGMCSATGSCICNDPAEQSLDCSGHEVTGTIGNADDNDTQLLHNLSIVTENSTVVAASPDSAGADTAAAIAGGISGAIVFILIVGILAVLMCRARKTDMKTAHGVAELPMYPMPDLDSGTYSKLPSGTQMQLQYSILPRDPSKTNLAPKPH